MLPVAVLGFLGHPGEWRLQAAQVVVELAGVAQHQQVLILVLLADATATKKEGDVRAQQTSPVVHQCLSWSYKLLPDLLSRECPSPVQDRRQTGRLPWRFTLLFAGLPLLRGLQDGGGV